MLGLNVVLLRKLVNVTILFVFFGDVFKRLISVVKVYIDYIGYYGYYCSY